MAATFRYCGLCYKFTVEPRFLPKCNHSFCHRCILDYYDQRQRTSVMRIAALPCPEQSCRLFSEVPPGGVYDFPRSAEAKETDHAKLEPDRVDPAMSERARGGPKTSDGMSKKRVTFSDDDKSEHEEPSRSATPVFRSTAKFMIGNLLPQQEVDIPDSAVVLATPDIWTGSDVVDHKKFGETRFVFPSVSSALPEPEINGNQVTWTNSSAIANETEAESKALETCNRLPGANNRLATGQLPDHGNLDTNRCTDENRPIEVELAWRVTKNAHHKPTSMVLTPQGHAIVADYGKGTLEYLDENGTTTSSINSLKPFAVLLTTSGSVIVGDRRSKTLVFLEVTTAEVVSQWQPGCFEWVSGLGTLRNGNLVVSDRANCRIGVYTPDGRRVTEFGSYGAGDDNLCMADFLAVDSKDRIIVSDSANHCIKVFDVCGTPLSKFSGRGSTDGRLSWPKGICVDRMDNIVVADSTNCRLSVFSTSGDFIRHLVSDIPSPFGVCHQSEADMIGLTHYSLSGYSQCDVYRLQ